MKKVCTKCGSNTTTKHKHQNGKYYDHWRRVEGSYWCNNCWLKYIHSPKWRPIHNPLRLTYKGKQQMIKGKTMTGQCNICLRKKGDEFTDWYGKLQKVKQTQLHHLNYHDDNKLKDTIELCPSCHGKLTWKQSRERGCRINQYC